MPRKKLIVSVWLRCELTPAEDCLGLQNNEMFSDLNAYLQIKSRDRSLQMNSTKIKIDPTIKLVWDE